NSIVRIARAARVTVLLSARPSLPCPYLLISPSDQPLAVPAQRQAADPIGVSAQGEGFLAGLQVPHLDGLVPTPRDQPLAVPAQGQAADIIGVSVEGTGLFLQLLDQVAILRAAQVPAALVHAQAPLHQVLVDHMLIC